MLIKRPDEIKSSEITAKKVYLNRRLFMRLRHLRDTAQRGSFIENSIHPPPKDSPGETIADVTQPASEEAISQGFKVNEKLTALEDITNYNNFYEFSTDKRSVAIEARNL